MWRLRLALTGLALWLALATPALARAPPTVGVAQNPILGKFLTDGRGMTLYRFTNDQPNVSACTGGCAQAWPPLTLATGQQPSGDPSLPSGALGTLTRPDSATQVTYQGAPLYLYSGDTQPGDTLGQGVAGAWFVVQPAAS